jgi:hypothetical protein
MLTPDIFVAPARPPREIYLANPSHGLPSAPVLKAMQDYLEEEAEWGGAMSVQRHREQIDAGYAAAARLIGAEVDEVAFLESGNRALQALILSLRLQPGDHVLVDRTCWGHADHAGRSARRGGGCDARRRAWKGRCGGYAGDGASQYALHPADLVPRDQRHCDPRRRSALWPARSGHITCSTPARCWASGRWMCGRWAATPWRPAGANGCGPTRDCGALRAA